MGVIKDIFRAITSDNYEVSIGRRIVTFLGTRGGVGTTTYALDTAVTLAQGGKQVLFIDGNLDTPNAYRFLLKEPDKLQTTLKEALLRSDLSIDVLITETKYKNLRLISGAPGTKLGDYSNIRQDVCEKLISLAEQRFDVVVIDACSNPYLELTVAAVGKANSVFLITEPDKQLFLTLAKLKDFLTTMTGENKLRYVIQNKVTLRSFEQSDFNLIGLENFGTIPYVPELNNANVKDRLLMYTRAFESSGYAYKAIIEKIIDTISGH